MNDEVIKDVVMMVEAVVAVVTMIIGLVMVSNDADGFCGVCFLALVLVCVCVCLAVWAAVAAVDAADMYNRNEFSNYLISGLVFLELRAPPLLLVSLI